MLQKKNNEIKELNITMNNLKDKFKLEEIEF